MKPHVSNFLALPTLPKGKVIKWNRVDGYEIGTK